MLFRICLCLCLALLTSCAPARMAILPGLENDSVKYPITSMPGFFSGGDMVFGPYRATEISRSGITTTGSGWSIKGTGIGSEHRGQEYTYRFKGDKRMGCGLQSAKRKLAHRDSLGRVLL